NYKPRSGDACTSTTFEARAVGGGDVVLATGTVGADGSFTLTWTAEVETGMQPDEVVLSFACATSATSQLKCYGKPGDAQLVCDPVPTGGVAALEAAIGAEVAASDLYKGLSVAKIAQGIVEPLKLLARISPTANFAPKLATATSPADLKAIIDSSPVGT